MPILLVLLFFLSSRTEARQDCLALEFSLAPILDRQYWNLDKTSGYVPYRCETNASYLANNLKSYQQSLVVAVWQRSETQNWRPIQPLKPRQDKAAWSYHVFLLVDGLVMDLDFETYPRIINLAQYLEEMYGPQIQTEASLWFAAWPLSEYGPSRVGRSGPRSMSDILLSSQDFKKKVRKEMSCSGFSEED